jgi:hypothetical protein
LIGNKRKVVSEEFSSLSSAVEENSKKVCYGISSLQSSSDQILADVTMTTEKMNASTSSDLSAFSSFLFSNGNELSKEITNHFTGIKEDYSQEEMIVKDLSSEVLSYSEGMKETVVAKSGKTPRKQLPFQSNKPKETREYERIKQESKGSSALKDITYEMIHEQLPKYQTISMNLASSSQEMDIIDNNASISTASSFEKPPLSRCPSNESMKSSSSAGSDSLDESENSNPNVVPVVISGPISVSGKESGIPSSGGGKNASRLTRSSSKGRTGISGISTRQRSGSSSVTATTAVSVDPSTELEYN